MMQRTSRHQIIPCFQFGNYNSRRSRYQQFYNNNNEFFRRNSIYNSRLSTTTTTTTTTTPRPSLTGQYADQCGLRHSGYRADQRARGGRIIWTDEESAGATSAPEGTFPWLASLFLRRESGEAYFMCAATILTPNVLVSAAHCFNEKWEDSDWFVRVGDNFILKADPSEQTFQASDERRRNRPDKETHQFSCLPLKLSMPAIPLMSAAQFDMRPTELSLSRENKTNRYTTQVTPLISLRAPVALVFIYHP